MRKILILTSFLLIFCTSIRAQEDASSDTDRASSLLGEWIIDLRPTPDAEAYFQSFVVESIEENSFKGTFYGSELENSLLNREWDKLYFAFSTNDSSNAYYHSGYLEDGKIYGMTYCPGRNFTAPWTGVKK